MRGPFNYRFGLASPFYDNETGLSPADLFAVAGSRGFFYDFSDYSTQFTDTAGTTAITGVGQSLGLVLDKSAGLALGPNLFSGSFITSVAGGTATATESPPGTLNITGDGTNQARGDFSFTSVIGRTYRLVVTVAGSAASVAVGTSQGGNTIVSGSAVVVGSNTIHFVATSTTTWVRYFKIGAVLCSLSATSVRELPGNHATQATAGSRALTQVRPMGVTPRNLLTFSEAFDNAVWTKQNCTILTNSAIAPDGTSTADKIRETAVTAAFSVGVAPTMALNTTHTLSVYMKAAERNFGVLNIFTGAASCWTWYDLASGTVGTVGSGATASISSVGNGWYRCVLTIATAASGSPNVAMWPAPANNTLTYAGTLDSGILIWGAQLELGSTASTYQPTGPALINGEKRNLLTFTSFEGGVAGTPGTPPTGFPFNSSGGSITSISDGVISMSATAARQIIGPTVTVGANQTQVWRVRLGSNPNALVLNQLFVVVNSAGLTSLVYYVNGNPVDQTSYAPVAGDILSAVLINGATPLTTTVFRIGVGASSNATGSASFSQPQAELGPTPTAYQRVVSTDEWYEPGFTSYRGIRFDGTDDFLQTAAIDFSNSDKMTVVAGVRKLSDAGIGSLVELTIQPDNNFGAFALRTPAFTPNSYAFRSTGSVGVITAPGTGFPAPDTAVLTGQADISGDIVRLNRNGVNISTATNDQGTGVYLNAPVFIGRGFGGTANPVNGVLTFLCVINRTLTAAELAQLETYANLRTGAY